MSGAAYKSTVLGMSPIALWMLDQTSGTSATESVAANTGPVARTATWQAGGPLGRYIELAGSNSGRWFDDASADRFTVGALAINNIRQAFHSGDIAYLTVLDHPLTTPERTSLYAWMSGYYGITI